MLNPIFWENVSLLSGDLEARRVMEPGPAGSVTDSRFRGHKFKFQLCHITFVEINHYYHFIGLSFKKGSCHLLAKVCAQVLVNCLED